MQASRLEDLRLKLEKDGLVNISYVIVNHQGKPSQLKYHRLKDKVSEHIPVYQQDEQQPDIWSLLNGNKDDILIYDRCGRLLSHLELPYTFLSFPYVEEAIRSAYCEDQCGICNQTSPLVADICNTTLLSPTERIAEEQPPEEAPKPHHQGHDPRRHHHHHHHHHNGGHLEDPMLHRGMGQSRHGHLNGQEVVDTYPQKEGVGPSPQREIKVPHSIRP